MVTYVAVPADSEESLEHYGVLGMKWGVRKDRSKAINKSYKKLGKLTSKSEKYAQKASVQRDKAQYHSQKMFDNRDRYYYTGKKKYNKRAKKAGKKAYKESKATKRLTRRSVRSTKKARRWANAMSEHIGTMKSSELNKDQMRLGKQYCLDIIEDRGR